MALELAGETVGSESAAASFGVHAYCLMPDHLHFLVEGMDASCNLLRFVKTFKLKSSRQYSSRFGQILWHRNFYEHILQRSDSAESIAWYIWLNPVRKALVTCPEQYPYSGSMTGWTMPHIWNTPAWRPPWKKTFGMNR